MAKKRRVKKRVLIPFFIFIVCFLISMYYVNDFITKRNEQKEKEALRLKKEEEKKNLALYNDCLHKPFNENNKSEALIAKENAILASLRQNGYEVSFVYENIYSGYQFSYNKDKRYYGASLIKLVDALYLMNKAGTGDISLEDKIIYNSKFKSIASECMNKYTPGSEVSLNNILECALTVSDNAAHQLLINYIGYNNLKNYGKSLGARYILEGGDNFGNQSANDMIIYLKKLNEYITLYPDMGNSIKKYLDNNYYNYLRLSDEVMIHKYGYYDIYYHDVGIVYDNIPYYISVMTLHGNDNYVTVTKNISKKINELNKLYSDELQKSCHNLVYKK